MNRILIALVSGLLFGLGLVVSQMVNPEKVLSFLDVFGNWDPSLAFVMGAAVLVAALGFTLAKWRQVPLYAPSFSGPTKTKVDARLVVGSLIFGTGWGLVGYCPGPVLASFLLAGPPAVVFLAAMLTGMVAFSAADKHLPGRTKPA
ncbi:hypothetical protein CR162_08620 [Pseudoroseomonas rhizosphaerae]|uniref:Transporter n=1 Tax=Teichococcus rhizosphaerae TaxID=1335062 RepID=A0A2C7AAZ4_9PROT|nr:YeeE/YedE family protein [Pseudoroseomonas rhizosphaerae]PHK95229.1 hypothetical protein CR162_08620 [Pseudoroseomonas rhizosphaerae]